ncbi:hypothetical protein [Corynebacterium striatum]|uniref:hypothetical protein n=1 Tax=Corynebacterium striatum TaxID=43770 RepID=UPI0027BA601A|nr:hypothetical protein [Corynebacterium striatum]
MDKPARFISDLDTDEIVTRLLAYIKLEGQCLRALCDRSATVEDLHTKSRDAFLAGRDPRGNDEDDETAAMDWLRFIVNESFNPVFEDPAEELIRLQRYLVTASLVATESGGLPDET